MENLVIIRQEMFHLEMDLCQAVYEAKLALHHRRGSEIMGLRPLEVITQLKGAIWSAEELEIRLKNVRKHVKELEQNPQISSNSSSSSSSSSSSVEDKGREMVSSAKKILKELLVCKDKLESELRRDIDMVKFSLLLYYLLIFFYFPFSVFSSSSSSTFSLYLSFVGVFFFFNSLDFHFIFFNYLFFTSFPSSSSTYSAIAFFYLFYFLLYLVICAHIVTFTYLLTLLGPGERLRFYIWGKGVVTNLHRIRNFYSIIGGNINFGGTQIIRPVNIAGNIVFGEAHRLAQKCQGRVVSLAGTVMDKLRFIANENADDDEIENLGMLSCVATELKIIASVELFPYRFRICHLLYYYIVFFYYPISPLSSLCSSSSSSSRFLFFAVVYVFFDTKPFHYIYFIFLLYSYLPKYLFLFFFIFYVPYYVILSCMYFCALVLVVAFGIAFLKFYRWVVHNFFKWIYTRCFVGGNINFGGTQIIEDVSLGDWYPQQMVQYSEFIGTQGVPNDV